MKLAAILAAAMLAAAPASADVLLGAGCGGAQTVIAPASNTKSGTRIVIVKSACEGPRREVIHTLAPGEPMQTTILIRKAPKAPDARGSGNVIRVRDRNDFTGGSQARILRVGD